MATAKVRAWREATCLVLIFLFVAGSLSGCGPLRLGAANPPPAQAAQKVTASSNALSFELLGGLSKRASEGNVVISPLSVASLLAMLLAGARGDTADAIAEVMQLDGSTPEDAASFGQLLRYLAESSNDVDLTIANAVWPRTGYELKQDFVSNLKQNFDANVSELDLGSQSGADTIDQWVSEKTRGLIKKMSDALRLPDPQAVMVLMNAVYFKGSWTSPFDPDQTRPGDFTLLDGSTIQVPMMAQRHEFEISRTDGLTLIRLPYGKSERFAMDILLPGAGEDAEAFAQTLDEQTWMGAVGAREKREVYIMMPTFELEYKATEELDDLNKELGMSIAYSPQADFSGMSSSMPRLSRIAHKTYIQVNEEGTEAAGVSGGVMVESMPQPLEVNQPFVFVISDTQTDTILFTGFVTDPTAR